MRLALLPLAALALAMPVLAGCARDGVRSYAGSPGSTYDAAGNPPKANGAVTYNPASPITPHDFGNGGTPAPVR